MQVVVTKGSVMSAAVEPHTLRWTWLIRETSFGAKRMRWLAFELAAHANEQNECFPSLTKLLDNMTDSEVRISKKTLQRYLKALEAFGFIAKEVGKGRKGKGEWNTNRYTLTFPALLGEVTVKVDRATYWADIPLNDPGSKGVTDPRSKGDTVKGTLVSSEERHEEPKALMGNHVGVKRRPPGA